jgi:hypothetical protein
MTNFQTSVDLTIFDLNTFSIFDIDSNLEWKSDQKIVRKESKLAKSIPSLVFSILGIFLEFELKFIAIESTISNEKQIYVSCVICYFRWSWH